MSLNEHLEDGCETITGKDLISLGFKKEHDDSDSRYPYHYYVYEINEKCILISNCNDEKINNGYNIEFFEFDDLSTSNLEILTELVNTIKKMK